MDLLGNIELDVEDDLINFQDFCRLFKLINKYMIRVPSVRLLVQQRREALKNEEIKDYREMVFEV